MPATNIWLWGLGKTPSLIPFEKLHGKRGAMITAVDLLRGLGVDYLQGYAISRPLARPKVLEWIAGWPAQAQQRLRPK